MVVTLSTKQVAAARGWLVDAQVVSPENIAERTDAQVHELISRFYTNKLSGGGRHPEGSLGMFADNFPDQMARLWYRTADSTRWHLIMRDNKEQAACGKGRIDRNLGFARVGMANYDPYGLCLRCVNQEIG